MDRSIRAGISGFLLAATINLLSPTYLDFIPSFLAAMLTIYMFRIGTIKDGLVVAFMTYIFNDAILGTMDLASLYLANEPYTINVDVWTVFSPIVNAVTALIAGYIGVRIVQRMKPESELPSPPQDIPKDRPILV